MSDATVVPIVAMGLGTLIVVISIIFGVVKRIVVSRATETSRREIAAYVAEGAMTAEEGERLLQAGKRACR
tara:strand:- start:5 stop:217 length:213 start_codon:yes stop_codon:yes gene_type:complete